MTVRYLNPSHWTSGKWQDTDPLAFVEMSFHIEMESSEQVKCFLRGKIVLVDIRHTRAQRVASLWFESLIWDIAFGFPLADYFDVPGFQSVFGTSQDLPCVSMCIFQPRWILAKKRCYGELDIIPLLISNEPFSWEDLFDLENEIQVVSYFSPGLGLLLLLLLLWNLCSQEEKKLLLLTLGGIYLLP